MMPAIELSDEHPDSELPGTIKYLSDEEILFESAIGANSKQKDLNADDSHVGEKEEGAGMELAEVAKLLGLGENATEADVKTALATQNTDLSEALAKVKTLEEGGNSGLTLSEAEVTDLRSKANAGEQASLDLAEMKRDNVVTLALNEGRLDPKDMDKQRGIFDNLVKACGFEAAEGHFKALPIRTDLTEHGSGKDGGDAKTELSEADKVVAGQLGTEKLLEASVGGDGS